MKTDMVTTEQNERLDEILREAQRLARQNRHAHYGAAHLLSAVMGRTSVVPKLLAAWSRDPDYFVDWAEMRVENMEAADMIVDHPTADDSANRVFDEAEKVRLRLGIDRIDHVCTFIALITPGVAWSVPQLQALPISHQEVVQLIAERGFSSQQADPSSVAMPQFEPDSDPNKGVPYCIPVPEDYLARGRKTVGRDNEVRSMREALQRHYYTGVLVVGDAGVGKTAVLQAYAHEIAEGLDEEEAPTILLLETARLVTGTAYGGEIDNRLGKVLDKARKLPRCVLIMDDLHLLLDDKAGGGNAGNTLGNAISQGGLAIVASINTEGFVKKIEANGALVRKLELIRIQEPDAETAVKCLEVHLTGLEKHHGLRVADEAIREATLLAKRYLKDRKLPDASINLIDRTLAAVSFSNANSLTDCVELAQQLEQLAREYAQGVAEEVLIPELRWLDRQISQKLSPVLLGQVSNETNAAGLATSGELLSHLTTMLTELKRLASNPVKMVSITEVAALVAHMTGIPMGKIQAQEKDKLVNLETHLKRRVVGQDHAIRSLADAIVESRSGMNPPGKPIGSFFFLGPTGTGKTELAKSLAELLFNDEQAMIRFDMSEFKEEHSAALLYGAPPGYVGYEEGGLLVNKVRQQPYSVVLFDEIEKAHPSVYDIFLQIMDEGHIHDRLGKKGSFVDTIVIFTSNIGSEWIAQQFRSGHIPNSGELIEIMAGKFRPEFLGRITEVVPFGPIREDAVAKIFDIQMKKVLELLDQKGVQLSVSDKARAYFAKIGYSDRYGARPIASVIRNHIRRPLSKMLVGGQVVSGMNIQLDLDDQAQLVWSVADPEPIVSKGR